MLSSRKSGEYIPLHWLHHLHHSPQIWTCLTHHHLQRLPATTIENKVYKQDNQNTTKTEQLAQVTHLFFISFSNSALPFVALA